MPSRASTSPSSRPAASVSAVLAPEAVARGALVVDNSSPVADGSESVPLVVAEVNPDDAALHEGIIANPNCSTMQLVPLLMALRDAVGLERVIVDTYQAVGGTGARGHRRSSQAQIGPTSPASPSGPPSTRTRSPSTRCPRSTSSSTTATPRRSGRSSTRAARSSTCPTCGSPARPSGCRSSSATPRPSTSRPATRSTPDEARELFAAVPGRRRHRRAAARTAIRSPPRPPAATRSSSGASAPDVSMPDGRGLAFWCVERQPAQGRRDQRRPDRRAGHRARLAGAGRGPGGRVA